METFDLRYPFTHPANAPRQVVLAMGFFDGVHLGHQAVLAKARALATAKGVPLAVMTYDHHPHIVFQKLPTQYQYLSPNKRQNELFAMAGVDVVYRLSFTSKLAKLTPQAFVDEVLMALDPVAVVAGFDHTYGADINVANMEHLPTFVAGRFDVISVPKADFNHEKIGSRTIHEVLDAGQVDLANEMLGYTYQTTGLIVHGEALGRTLGFPTANVLTPADEKIPGVGVYGVRVKIADQWYEGDASVGYNQTIGEGRPKTLEIFIFDFHEEIYGENVEVQWCHYVRGMEKFAGLEELVAQLHQDEADVRAFFANEK
ncbi:riboflavin biosynthesis protein RibF [Periweissella fabaria]|uniref:Riboflavin biosynthesis protein n=1 Tax=Periweissella fabaria TaxID=546157 RepID=A0ABM8Z3B9_9LACO|nr:riboflavin biosynthesis protein RibF [Periweissella fabaria]MCM0596535.1 riboflavin biosynthesis protein RibF [Periweissella fabaria]CAH0415736.1 Bifunctional riboflavin kinase/FMN adenylyltransferase [Periweissella fabaria]